MQKAETESRGRKQRQKAETESKDRKLRNSEFNKDTKLHKIDRFS